MTRGFRQVRMEIHRRESAAPQYEAGDEVNTKVADVFASLQPQSGDEDTQGQRQRGKEAFLIRLRWGPSLEGMDSSWWGKIGARTFHFRSVRNVEERSRWFEVDATEV